MELLKRLVAEEDGQGLIEYSLICLLVALVFWVAIKDTKVGDELKTQWANIVTALQSSSGS